MNEVDSISVNGSNATAILPLTISSSTTQIVVNAGLYYCVHGEQERCFVKNCYWQIPVKENADGKNSISIIQNLEIEK